MSTNNVVGNRPKDNTYVGQPSPSTMRNGEGRSIGLFKRTHHNTYTFISNSKPNPLSVVIFVLRIRNKPRVGR